MQVSYVRGLVEWEGMEGICGGKERAMRLRAAVRWSWGGDGKMFKGVMGGSGGGVITSLTLPPSGLASA